MPARVPATEMFNWELMRNPVNWFTIGAFSIFWLVFVWIIANEMHERAAPTPSKPQQTGNYT